MDQFGDDSNEHEEFAEDEGYVGPLSGCPAPSFRVGCDIYNGYFVAIQLANDDNRPVWIARVLFDPNSNLEKPNCVLIQYFCPTSRSWEVQDNYIGWDNDRGLCWRVNETELPLWEHMNALMTTWSSIIRNNIIHCLIKILFKSKSSNKVLH